MARHRAHAGSSESTLWTPESTPDSGAKHALAGNPRKTLVRGAIGAAVLAGATLVTLPLTSVAALHDAPATSAASLSAGLSAATPHAAAAPAEAPAVVTPPPAPAAPAAPAEPAVAKAAPVAKPAVQQVAKPAVAKAAPVAAPAAATTSAGLRAANIALAQIGKPYVWGATGPSSFDCSGLVQYAYHQVGVSLPRTTYAQDVVGTPVSQANLQLGDLVFFYGGEHVGIYVGNGNVVHAPEPGQLVKITSMKYMPFYTARRVG